MHCKNSDSDNHVRISENQKATLLSWRSGAQRWPCASGFQWQICSHRKAWPSCIIASALFFFKPRHAFFGDGYVSTSTCVTRPITAQPVAVMFPATPSQWSWFMYHIMSGGGRGSDSWCSWRSGAQLPRSGLWFNPQEAYRNRRVASHFFQ